MGKIILDITMSLDGFVAGPNPTPEQPLGKNGEQLHRWIFEGKTDIDAKVLAEVVEGSGAVIVGGRTYHDAIDDAWDGVTPFDAPAFVLSKNVPKEGKIGFTFVPEGLESAVKQAKAAAGDKNIWVMGGATIAQQFLEAGLIDEMQIHLAPLLLGQGIRLFDQIGAKTFQLESTGVIKSEAVTHLKFRVIK